MQRSADAKVQCEGQRCRMWSALTRCNIVLARAALAMRHWPSRPPARLYDQAAWHDVIRFVMEWPRPGLVSRVSRFTSYRTDRWRPSSLSHPLPSLRMRGGRDCEARCACGVSVCGARARGRRASRLASGAPSETRESSASRRSSPTFHIHDSVAVQLAVCHAVCRAACRHAE